MAAHTLRRDESEAQSEEVKAEVAVHVKHLLNDPLFLARTLVHVLEDREIAARSAPDNTPSS